MNDVTEICRRALEEPGPPLPAAATMLAHVRRAARRRTRRLTAGAGLAAGLAAVVAGGTVLPHLTDRSADGTTVGGPATPQVTVSPRLPASPRVPADPRVPSAEMAEAHGPALAAALVKALPPGYAGRTERLSDDQVTTWSEGTAHPGYAFRASVLVTAGGGTGRMAATVFGDGIFTPPAEPCTAILETRPGHQPIEPQMASCDTVAVGTVRIGVGTRTDPRAGRILTAFRFMDGWMVQVEVRQGTAPTDADPAPAGATVPGPTLAALPFTVAQLAALAADPALLP